MQLSSLSVRRVIGLLVFFQCQLPLPYIHSHGTVDVAQLTNHVEQLHPNVAEVELPSGWHVHLLWIGNSWRLGPNPDGEPEQRQPGPKAFVELDAEEALEGVAACAVAAQRAAQAFGDEGLEQPLILRGPSSRTNLSCTFAGSAIWRTMIQVHIA
jgi:hypothetical protein